MEVFRPFEYFQLPLLLTPGSVTMSAPLVSFAKIQNARHYIRQI